MKQVLIALVKTLSTAILLIIGCSVFIVLFYFIGLLHEYLFDIIHHTNGLTTLLGLIDVLTVLLFIWVFGGLFLIYYKK